MFWGFFFKYFKTIRTRCIEFAKCFKRLHSFRSKIPLARLICLQLKPTKRMQGRHQLPSLLKPVGGWKGRWHRGRSMDPKRKGEHLSVPPRSPSRPNLSGDPHSLRRQKSCLSAKVTWSTPDLVIAESFSWIKGNCDGGSKYMVLNNVLWTVWRHLHVTWIFPFLYIIYSGGTRLKK